MQSLIRAREHKLKGDVHIHVPAGAIPKDGPSAGVAMFSTLLSLVYQTPIRSDVSMTGEITLTGLVLAVGGVKEKILGAHRAGIKEIILPESCVKDLEEIPAEVLADLIIHPVSHVDELEAIIFDPSELEHGKSAYRF